MENEESQKQPNKCEAEEANAIEFIGNCHLGRYTELAQHLFAMGSYSLSDFSCRIRKIQR